ncbi:MAG: tetratricopeptide repeat protein [Pirellulaceae bacterium]
MQRAFRGTARARGSAVHGPIVLVAFALLACSIETRGQEPRDVAFTAFEAKLRTMLTDTWDTSLASQRTAQQMYAEMKELDSRDGRAEFGYAMVLIKQGQYRQAKEVLDDYLLNDRQSISALTARAWLSVLLGDHEAAAVQLETIARLLDDDDLVKLQSRSAVDAAKIAGRIIGYILGPADGTLLPNEIARRDADIVNTLDDPYRTHYVEARDGLLNEFRQLAQQRNETATVGRAKQQAERETKLKALRDESQQVQQLMQQADAQRSAVDADRRRALDAIDAKRSPLQDKLNTLDARVATSRQQIAFIEAELHRLDLLIDTEPDPYYRSLLIRDHDRFVTDQRRLIAALAAIRSQVSPIVRELDGLAAQSSAVHARFDPLISAADQQWQQQQRVARRIDADLRRLAAQGDRVATRVRAMDTTRAALTTYVRFPIEVEKQELLQGLGRR